MAAPWVAAPSAETPSGGEDEPIVIRADRAWEAAAADGGDSDVQVLHLQGNFEMRSADWRVMADSAEVRGPLQDPEQLIAIGRPARIHFTYDDSDLSLSGSKILYDLKAERLQSSGDDGIQFTLSEKSPNAED